MRNFPIDILEPVVSPVFTKSKFPAKPIIAVSSREQREAINLIKTFYQKYPQFRWVTFRDMRGISEEEFANTLKDCMLSVWIDKTSSFGTFPLESMKSNVPVLGVVPKMIPSWLNEENGIWIQEEIKLVVVMFGFDIVPTLVTVHPIVPTVVPPPGPITDIWLNIIFGWNGVSTPLGPIHFGICLPAISFEYNSRLPAVGADGSAVDTNCKLPNNISTLDAPLNVPPLLN